MALPSERFHRPTRQKDRNTPVSREISPRAEPSDALYRKFLVAQEALAREAKRSGHPVQKNRGYGVLRTIQNLLNENSADSQQRAVGLLLDYTTVHIFKSLSERFRKKKLSVSFDDVFERSSTASLGVLSRIVKRKKIGTNIAGELNYFILKSLNRPRVRVTPAGKVAHTAARLPNLSGARVEDFLAPVSHPDKDAIRKRFGVSGEPNLSVREIANMYGVTHATVHYWIARGFSTALNLPKKKRKNWTTLLKALPKKSAPTRRTR